MQPGSVFPLSIGGHLALTATAEFESRGDGRPRIERLAWIFTPESRVLFFATMSPDQLAAFQPEFDTIAGSANLP